MIDLAKDWIAAKKAEAEAQETRRLIEDKLIKAVGIPNTLEGTSTREAGPYKIKIVGRVNRKVDADLVQVIAAETGCEDHLQSLFRWKPEINAAAWKGAPEFITKALSKAVTTTPGRPSFDITEKE